MAYEKTTWANGDVITAEKLNNMEDGIAANSVLFINLVVQIIGVEHPEVNWVSEERYSDILEAINNDKLVVVILSNTYGSAVDYLYLGNSHPDSGFSFYQYNGIQIQIRPDNSIEYNRPSS